MLGGILMDYSKLSDKEIAAKLLIAQGYRFIGDSNGYSIYHSNAARKDIGPKALKCFAFDPCNNPADAWPIILGHKISIINADDEWLCVQDGVAIDGVIGESVSAIFSDGAAAHQNPLRAAMIVFLMMQEGE
jgi:hypothetical protein